MTVAPSARFHAPPRSQQGRRPGGTVRACLSDDGRALSAFPRAPTYHSSDCEAGGRRPVRRPRRWSNDPQAAAEWPDAPYG
ncbi:hypothetical protein GUJ93_ZPchr1126g16411 [Zizania palustris]|uniref:Uncharacterized protein n=1 Tax=Zizania palustris TaxID=103762 RepID=A0A8J5W035_ZIZPA|nr:hypothetical protein GUJ93_ZPchr1126g16411 [Zizania palustris]